MIKKNGTTHKFPGWWISRGPLTWPAHLLDLTQMWFFAVGYGQRTCLCYQVMWNSLSQTAYYKYGNNTTRNVLQRSGISFRNVLTLLANNLKPYELMWIVKFSVNIFFFNHHVFQEHGKQSQDYNSHKNSTCIYVLFKSAEKVINSANIVQQMRSSLF